MARQLGTLTIDLIAKIGGFVKGMTDAERVADRKSREMERKLKTSAEAVEKAWAGVGTVLSATIAGISISGAVASVISLAKETASAAKEIESLSRISGASTTRFQELAYGAQQVGVSGEKLADIYKDVQDKFGDFAQTGGGEMKDFFEKIAPKVGVTIDQFRKLSGPEALQLFYSSLQKANLSQQDMVFYLEAVANDATALQPLLQDNGKAWNELAAEAQKYGVVLSSEALEASAAYREESRKLESNLQGIKNAVAMEVLPALTQLNSQLADENTRQAFATLMGWVVDLTNVVVQATANIVAFINTKNKLGAVFGTDEFGKLTASAEGASAHVARLTDTLERHQEALNRDPGNARLQRNVDKTRALLNEAQSAAMGASDALKNWANQKDIQVPKVAIPEIAKTTGPLSPVTPPKSEGGKSQAEKDAEAAKKYLESLNQQAFKAQQRTAYEQLFFDIQNKSLKLSSGQLDKAVGLATAIDMIKEAERARAAEVEHNNTLYEAQNRLIAKEQQYQLELMTYGMGDRSAAELRERIELLQQHQAELRKLEQDQVNALAGAGTDEDRSRVRELYADRLKIAKSAQVQEVALFDDLIEQRRAKEGDWLSGAQSALDTYLETAGNSYEQAKSFGATMYGDLTEMGAEFIKSGKVNFKSLIDSWISQGARLASQQLFAGLFGSQAGSGFIGSIASFFGGGRANGGGVSAGKMYEVNERGVPELLNIGNKQFLMMAGQSGAVSPLDQATASAPAAFASASMGAVGNVQVDVKVQVDASGGGAVSANATGGNAALMAELGKGIGNMVNEYIARAMRPGGLLWNANQGRR